MLGNLGPWEIILILLVVLLVFGAKRLPEMGAAMGKGIREFKKNITEVKDSINAPDEPASRSLSGNAERSTMNSPTNVDEREPKKLSE